VLACRYRDRKQRIEKDVDRTDRAVEFFAGEDNDNVQSMLHILLTSASLALWPPPDSHKRARALPRHARAHRHTTASRQEGRWREGFADGAVGESVLLAASSHAWVRARLLLQVLFACSYSFYNFDLGYCQGKRKSRSSPYSCASAGADH
jgi:hypothetical protein